jgi:hypothetical protein
MEPLDLRRVNWQPGMLIRHHQFDSLDEHARAQVAWVLRHGGRTGVVRPPGSMERPIDIEVRIEREELVVRVRRCVAITPGGCTIDIQPSSDFDARAIPEARCVIDLSAEDLRTPVILECLNRDADLLVGEPEADGRVPWRASQYRVHLDEKSVGDPAAALQIAELCVSSGHVIESSDYFPPTPWIQNIPGLVVAFSRLQEQVERLRSLLIHHLKTYPPNFASERREFPILRGVLSDLLARLSILDTLRTNIRSYTPPDEAFSAYVAFLDGVRNVIEANTLVYESIRVHYIERQPPVHKGAIDFLRELISVRNWYFDAARPGSHLPRISNLLDQLVFAFDEPVREMMGPEGTSPPPPDDLIPYHGKYFKKLLSPSIQFGAEWMEISGLPQEVINELIIRFPRQGLPPNRRFGVQYAPDFRTIFDFRDGLFDDQETEGGYCYVLMQISRVVQTGITVDFNPRDPFRLLGSMAEDYNRKWWAGWL